MKKILSLLLILSLVFACFSLVSCAADARTFPAIIRSASGDHFIVEGLPENDVNHTWRFQFSLEEDVRVLENGKKISAELLEVGDMIEITYSGSVLEISPAIIQNVLKIERTAAREELGDKYPAVYQGKVLSKTETSILVSSDLGTGAYEISISDIENAFFIHEHDYIQIFFTGKSVSPTKETNGHFEHITAVETTQKAGSGTVYDIKDGYIHVGHSTLSISADIPILHNGKRISFSDIHHGDQIRYWYDGVVFDTYPSQISGIQRLELLEDEISAPTSEFLAYIEEIDGNKITVRGDTENTDSYFHARFTFTLTDDTPLYEGIYQKLEFPLGVGDRIRIVWSGTIADLAPAIIDHVVVINRLDAANVPPLETQTLPAEITEIDSDILTVRDFSVHRREYKIPILYDTLLSDHGKEISQSELLVGDIVSVKYLAPLTTTPAAFLRETMQIDRIASQGCFIGIYATYITERNGNTVTVEDLHNNIETHMGKYQFTVNENTLILSDEKMVTVDELAEGDTVWITVLGIVFPEQDGSGGLLEDVLTVLHHGGKS